MGSDGMGFPEGGEEEEEEEEEEKEKEKHKQNYICTLPIDRPWRLLLVKTS